jgi:hypothetical protein
MFTPTLGTSQAPEIGYGRFDPNDDLRPANSGVVCPELEMKKKAHSFAGLIAPQERKPGGLCPGFVD